MQIESPTIEYTNQTTLEGSVYCTKKTGLYSDIKIKLEEIIQNLTSKEDKTIEDRINDEFLNLDFGAEFDVDATKISPSDAIFFVNLLNQNQVINYSVKDDKITLNCSEKTISATNSLLNMLSTSIESKKPIRLDFDEDVTVILKMDKDGKIQAHFIPGTSAVETYLKNNLPSLKQIFDEENINYSSLSYSQNKNKNQQNSEDKKQKRSNQ
ncbi:flagellar hook-length control protein FliK [bacterium]|nr:flagellar hook-length control protein FliK [bacterium]